MKIKLTILLFLIFSIMQQYNTKGETAHSKEKQSSCDHCNMKLEECKREVMTLESQCRHYREEIGKWMKMYYESKEQLLEYTRQAGKTIAELTSKILQLNEKYGGK